MSISVLGIDTSNYTTSLALCVDGEITENIKVPLKVKEGGAGLRQSDAVFSHTVNLPVAFEKIESDISKIKAVGCSDKPRSVEGSYMPCFLCGTAAAASVSKALNIPVYYNSHQEGHIKAAVYSSEMPEYDRFYAYHLSGGTLELLTVSYDGESCACDITGKTLDITAGQLIDRVGVMLGMSFPCGAELERLSEKNTDKIPKIKVCVNGCDCNLSGFENKAEKLKKDGCAPSFIAAYVLEAIKETIDKMTENAFSEKKLPLLFSGGVSSNAYLRNYFINKYGAYFAKPAFSADNAAGTALITYQKVINGK
jgi:N6-L-threonylcarbamoyladenine synthase